MQKGAHQGQIISLLIGERGTQAGSTCWQLFSKEQGINLNVYHKQFGQNDFAKKFYQQKNGKIQSRSVICSSNQTFSSIKNSNNGQLFDQQQFINLRSTQTSNVKERINQSQFQNLLNCLRHQAQSCDKLNGFIMFRSLEQANGSLIGSFLLQSLSDHYKGVDKMDINIFSSKPIKQNAYIYNMAFATSTILEHQLVSITYSQDSLFRICQNNLNIAQPKFYDIDRLIAHSMSSTTGGMRLKKWSTGNSFISIKQIAQAMIPYQSFKFLVPSLSPIVSEERKYMQLSDYQVISMAFQTGSTLFSLDQKLGKYMAIYWTLRGNFTSRNIGACVCCLKSQRKKQIKFVDWSPTGFRLQLVPSPPPYLNQDIMAETTKSCHMLSNTTSIVSLFDNLIYDLQKLVSSDGKNINLQSSDLVQIIQKCKNLSCQYRQAQEQNQVEQDVS